ncbi:hypothetical protein [Thaumasiovibrio sp. DFM-14]|uniref:hypothetical protein n=1 Tax=Thaumasiovibrio sp. DFM-14 TaxID=3384792 RepID=UPI0039A28BCC
MTRVLFWAVIGLICYFYFITTSDFEIAKELRQEHLDTIRHFASGIQELLH